MTNLRVVVNNTIQNKRQKREAAERIFNQYILEKMKWFSAKRLAKNDPNIIVGPKPISPWEAIKDDLLNKRKTKS